MIPASLTSRPGLFKRWITRAIHQINYYPMDSMVFSVNTYSIYWIAFYPVESVVQPSNKWGQGDRHGRGCVLTFV